MLYAGNNYRKLTDQKGISFALRSSVINSLAGNVYFGFSGESQDLQFKFKKGKIYDPDNNYVNSYCPEKPFIISGDISKDYYNYYYNEESVARGVAKSDFKIEKFFINCDPGCTLSADLLIYSDSISYSVTVPDSITEGDTFDVTTTNNGDAIGEGKIYIYDINLKNSSLTNFSINSFTSEINPSSSGTINVSNVAGLQGYHSFEIELDTNIGKITKSSSIRLIGVEVIGVINSFDEYTENALDNFTYEEGSINNEGESFFEYISAIAGSNQPQLASPTLEYVEGNVGTYYKVTGVEITDSGRGYIGNANVSFGTGQGNDAQAEGETAMDNIPNENGVSGVNITKSGVYFENQPTVTFSGNLDPNDSAAHHAEGNPLMETYLKTFSNTWDMYTGLSLASVISFNENGFTGDQGEVDPVYPPGIYEPENSYGLASERKLFVKVSGKSFDDLDLMTVKLKVTGTLPDSNSGRYFEEFLITGGNKE